MVLVHRPRTNNVLAMYWVSTSPLAPSVLRFETVDFDQQLSPDGGGVFGVPLAPHLAFSLLRFKQPTFQ
jgi:hypothetical protein